METLLIEVHCLLRPDDARWDTIESLMLEVGYPGRNGPVHWKHTGWLREPPNPGLAKSFAHALWKRETADAVLVFEFAPQYQQPSGTLEKQYRLRMHCTEINGKTHIQKLQSSEGPVTHSFFSVAVRYPQTNT